MKNVILSAAVLLMASVALASGPSRFTTTPSKKPASESQPIFTSSSSGYSKDVFTLSGKSPKVGLTSNLVDLAKGTGNFGVQFYANEKVAATVSYYSRSFDEQRRKPAGVTKLAVNQTHYALGVAFHLKETTSRANLVINPSLAFGQERDPIDVSTQNGVVLKVAGQYKFYEQLQVEGGAYANNMDGGTLKTDPYLGLGFLF